MFFKSSGDLNSPQYNDLRLKTFDKMFERTHKTGEINKSGSGITTIFLTPGGDF
jgi:hypothetical protein